MLDVWAHQLSPMCTGPPSSNNYLMLERVAQQLADLAHGLVVHQTGLVLALDGRRCQDPEDWVIGPGPVVHP
jgi:hypothetical protein